MVVFDCSRDPLGRQWDVKLQHIYREANGVADLLAKRGTNQVERIREYTQSLAFVQHAVMFVLLLL